MSGLPEARAVSISTAGYQDGLGRRSVRFDREVGGMLECLHLRPELWAFEASLRQQADAVAALDDERFVRIRTIERAPLGLVVVSELVPGQRLIDVIENRQRDDGAGFGIDAALGFLLQALPALSALHAASIVHGTLAPGRIVVSPSAQIVLLDGIYAAPMERLKLNRRALWSSLGILPPPGAGAPRFDRTGDIAQSALCALFLALGRQIEGVGDLSSLAALVREVTELAEIRGGSTFARRVEQFFAAVLPLGGRVPSIATDEAAAEVRRVTAFIGEEASHAAFTELTRFDPASLKAPVSAESARTRRAAPVAPPAPQVAPAPLPKAAAAPPPKVAPAPPAPSVPVAPSVPAVPASAAKVAAPAVPLAPAAPAQRASAPIAPVAPARIAPPAPVAPPAPPVQVAPAPAAPPVQVVPAPVAPPAPAVQAVPAPAAKVAAPAVPTAPAAPVQNASAPIAPVPPAPIAPPAPVAPPALVVQVAPAPATQVAAPPLPAVPAPAAKVAAPAVPTAPAAPVQNASVPIAPVAPAPIAPPAPVAPPAPPVQVVPAPVAPPAPAVQAVPAPAAKVAAPAVPPAPAAPVQNASAPIAPVAPAPIAPPAPPAPAVQAVPAPAAKVAAPSVQVVPAHVAPPAPAVQVAPAARSMPQPFTPVAPLPPVQPAAVKVRAEPPSGYAPARTEAPSRPHAVLFNERPREEALPAFPWKLVAAAAIILTVGVVAGRSYLQDRAEPAASPAAAAAVTAPAPASAPAGKTGKLVIDSQPSGARITLDGADVGVTPLKLEAVPAGRHTLSIATATATVKRTVRVEAGRVLALDVPVYSGWIAVFSPIPLELASGDTSVGSTETGKILLPPGKHVLTLSNAEFGFSETRSVEIFPGEERALNVEPKGRVNINAHPWAEVWVDGKKAGDTPIANLQVLLGTRVFVFKHPQYGERRVTETIRASGAALSIDLTKQ